jgi:methylmalonyl-CoA/ethylmalonyl-CoA epimerase
VFKGIDHMVIAVNDLEQAVKDYEEKLGLKAQEGGGERPDLGLRNAYLPLGVGGSFIELAQPLGPDTPIGRTIARKGEGVHLVAMAVDDLQQAVARLKESGTQVIEAGSMVFIHPREAHGIMFQLVERK